jgi:hypothetical protein
VRREQGVAAQRLDDGRGKRCGGFVRGGMGEGSWARGHRGSRAVEEEKGIEEDVCAARAWVTASWVGSTCRRRLAQLLCVNRTRRLGRSGGRAGRGAWLRGATGRAGEMWAARGRRAQVWRVGPRGWAGAQGARASAACGGWEDEQGTG